ncbi:MAG: histidine phosphatase family protein [Anaerolineae bacterium]
MNYREHTDPFRPRRTDQERGTELLLVRHGQSVFNRDGEVAGTDSPLTDLGWRQARLVADWLAENHQVQALYTSPMRRALQTAQVVADRLGLTITIKDGLREAETWYVDELPRGGGPFALRNDGRWQITAKTAPIYHQFREEILQALEEILTESWGKTIVVVSHGGTMATIVRSLMGGHAVAVHSDNTAIHKFYWQDNRWYLEYLNRREHLLGGGLTEEGNP